MPAKSKAQFRFMQMLAHNKNKAKKADMTPEEAAEYASKNKGKNAFKRLPEKK